MSKDVLLDRYGRLYHFPLELDSKGYEVSVLLSDYHRDGSAVAEIAEFGKTGVRGVLWHSFSLAAPLRFWRKANELAAAADVIVASSDCLQVALAHQLSKKHNVSLLVDLYDNYESFGLARLPGLRSAFRTAVVEASAVTCVGHELASMIESSLRPQGEVAVLNSTISAGEFYPVDKREARTRLGLPVDGTLVGVCGGLTANRGIAHVYQALVSMWAGGSPVCLVLAGGLDEGVPPPQDERMLFLGSLPSSHMNDFYNSMDLNVLQYVDNDFGRYAYPQKLDEILATGSALIAARVGELECRFADTPALLYDPEDSEAIRTTINNQLLQPSRYLAKPQSWDSVGSELARIVGDLVRQART